MTRFRHVGLTNRLVALMGGLLVIGCLVVGIATTVALRTFLMNRLDAQLAAAGQRFSISLEHPNDGDADDSTFESTVGQSSGTLGARVFHGQVTAAGVIDDGSTQLRPSAEDRAFLARLTVSGHPRSLTLPDLGHYRIQVTAGHDQDVLITGLPLREVDEPVQHVIAAESIAFAAVVLIAALVGVGVIRRALGPLNRIASTARGVSALPLATGSVTWPDPVANPRPGTEIGDVTAAFNRMLEHMQGALVQRHADEEKLRHFVADASHELRTPVAVIASHAEYAQRERDEDPAAVDQALVRIRSESARMGRIVDDLLLLARLDLGRPLARSAVDLTRVVLDAVADTSRVAPDHRWRLDLPEEPVTIDGDEHALHQAVANLLTNARMHTPSGTEVRAGLDSDDQAVTLSVRDNGPGIPAELLPHIAERFTRADESRAHSDGSGLGLAITDAIVRAHEGTLTITSRPGDTRFTIRLPRRRVD